MTFFIYGFCPKCVNPEQGIPAERNIVLESPVLVPYESPDPISTLPVRSFKLTNCSGTLCRSEGESTDRDLYSPHREFGLNRWRILS